MSYPAAKLKDISLIKTGKLDSNAAEENGIYPFFTCDPQTLRINTWAYDTKAVLLAGNNASGNYTAKYYEGKFNAYQRTYIIESFDDSQLNIRYLCYAMNLQLQLLKTMSAGSTTKFLTIKMLHGLDIPFPCIETQNRIADILSAYDDLIENNQKQIKLLEEAAQRLYKEWFVDLRFPGYENTPITDGVPQGWEEYAISDLCEKIKAGGTPSRKKANYWNNASIKWYKTQELQDCWLIDSDEKISKEGQENSSAKFFPKNTLLMAIYASPTLGRLGILDSDATCNQAALCLKADETIISWQWLYEKLYELRDHYNGIARGAGQQNISGEVVKQTIVLCPTKEIMDIFTQIVAPWFEKRRMLQKQNISLTEARDRLLPKLMSGELEV